MPTESPNFIKRQKIEEGDGITEDEHKLIWFFVHKKISEQNKKRFRQHGIEEEDLYQDFAMQLPDIRRSFISTKSTKYSSFLLHCIQNIFNTKLKFLNAEKRSFSDTVSLSDPKSETNKFQRKFLTDPGSIEDTSNEEKKYAKEIIDRALSTENPFNLSENDRDVLDSYFVKGETSEEYAERVSLNSRATAHARLQKALAKLRKILNPEKIEE